MSHVLITFSRTHRVAANSDDVNVRPITFTDAAGPRMFEGACLTSGGHATRRVGEHVICTGFDHAGTGDHSALPIEIEWAS